MAFRPNLSLLSLTRKLATRLTNGILQPSSNMIEKSLSLETANQKQILHDKIHQAVEKYKNHDGDTGSSMVQIAVITERIYNLARHMAANRKDHSTKRGLEVALPTAIMCF